MERLTKRETEPLSNGEECVICNYEKEDCNNSCVYRWCKWSEKALKKLKAYEDKQEQGLLIELPCKVGDIVYVVRGGQVSKQKILSFTMTTLGNFSFYTTKRTISLSDFGDFVFLTRSEAEEALAKMGGK